jgi:aminoglycoside phosphotransferase (APT) family kinase protein
MTVPAGARTTLMSAEDQLSVAQWILSTAVQTLQAGVLPAVSGVPAARVERSARVLAWLSERLKRLDDGLPGTIPENVEREIHVLTESVEAVQRLLDSPPEAPAEALLADIDRLEGYLRAHPSGGADAVLGSVELAPGGRQEAILDITIHDASGFPGRAMIVLDQGLSPDQSLDPRNGSTGATAVAAEARLMRRLRAAGLKVPAVLAVETDAGVLGAAFMIVERPAGTGLATGSAAVLDLPRSEGLALQLAEQAGLLHALEADLLVADGALVEPEDGAGNLLEQIAGVRTVINDCSPPYPSVVAALDWLDSQAGRIVPQRAVIHGELGFQNVLTDGEQLAGLIGWRQGGVGHPARDLGSVKNAVEQVTSWDLFLEVYHDAGGPTCDPKTVDFYSVYSALWLYQKICRSSRICLETDARSLEYAETFAVLLPSLRLRLALAIARVSPTY